MKFAGISGGELVELYNALSVEINQELGVPCDDMTVVFEYSDNFPKLARIFALDDSVSDIEKAVSDGDVIFSGIADEQTVTADAASARITVYARSLAALLLDNECTPQSYTNPTAEVLFRRHLEPFGIKLCFADVKPKRGELRVYKGDSHYKVLERFSSVFLGTKLRIDHKGICHLNALDGGEAVFDNSGAGVTFNYIRVSDNSYSRISAVHIRTGSDGYSTSVKDAEAEKLGIIRERYLNADNLSAASPSDADRMISAGRNGSYTVTLKSREGFLNRIGCKARVNTPLCGERELTVSSVNYKLTSHGENTTITLEYIEI